MLVSVDEVRGTVTVYGTTVITVPINQYAKLRSLIGGRTVQYVQEVVAASGEEVLSLIAEIAGTGAVSYTPPRDAPCDDGRLWLHSPGSGQLYVKLSPKIKLKFEGPMDFCPLEKYGFDLFEKYPQAEALRRSNKLAVVSTSEMGRIKRQVEQEQTEKEELRMMNADGTSIIVDTGIKVKNGKAVVKHTSARNSRAAAIAEAHDANEIDMDAFDKERVSEVDMLPDEVKRAMFEGWGKPDTGTEEGEEGEEGE